MQVDSETLEEHDKQYYIKIRFFNIFLNLVYLMWTIIDLINKV